MPVSHRFSRRAAAIGAALALAALPISATFTPAFAQPSPTPTAEASSNADTEAAAGADATAGADSTSGDGSDSTADTNDGADAESSSADNGVTEVEGEADDNSDPNPAEDGACADSDEGPSLPSMGQPCEIENSLKATWNSKTHELSVTPNNDKPGSLPKSWENVEFDGPTDRGIVQIPAQDATSDDPADSTSSDSDTDDSGRSVAEATTQADAPTRFKFGADGKVRAAGDDEPMKFTGFGDNGPQPEWTFKSDGTNITASGEKYTDSDDGATASTDSDGTTKDGSKTGVDQDGTANSDPSADASTSSDGSTADSDASGGKAASKDGVTSDDGSASGSEANKDGSSADSDTGKDSSTSTDGSSSSDSGSKDRANTSGNKDSDSRDSDADTGSGSDGSRSSDSDGSGSDSGSGEDEEKDSDDNGSGSSVGTSDADGTTPDPATGNGSPDDERETIPGNAGDEFLPGDDEGAERPDYSDPVPRNPDEQTPKDDTDLITGGDQPSPRANQNPATSFGESIISTIVSSWPIFVLAASGMAAVGFIIYLMGRRGKQD